MTKAVEKKVFFLTPTPGRIIVREDDFSYRGQIIIPDASRRRPTTGTILAVGDGVGEYVDGWEKINDEITPTKTWVPKFKVGQKIVYGMYSGTVLQFKEQPAFRVLGQEEILAIVDDANLELQGVGVGT